MSFPKIDELRDSEQVSNEITDEEASTISGGWSWKKVKSGLSKVGNGVSKTLNGKVVDGLSETYGGVKETYNGVID